MALVSRGVAQATIVDLTDSRQLVAYIATDKQRQVVYNPNTGTYTPDYSKDPLVLTPELFISGNDSNVVASAKSIKWYVRPNSMGNRQEVLAGATYAFGSPVKTLTVKDNVLKNHLSMIYIAEITFTDPNSGEDVLITADIELIKYANGVDGADGTTPIVINILEPEGNVVKNNEGEVRGQVILHKGTEEVRAESYKWYKRIPSELGDSDSGPGWKLLTTTDPLGTAGYDTDTLTVRADSIKSSGVFMCIATYNGVKYHINFTVTDNSDPYDVQMLGVDTLRKEQGTYTYTVKVYRAGTEVDINGDLFTYEWHLYNADGSIVPNFLKTGKTITLTKDEITGEVSLQATVTK